MTVAPQAAAAAAPRSWMRDPRRWAWAGVGVGSVGIGWLGVFVPGLPTTVFLIIASYCFTRSCPWLEHRLLRVPVFAPYMRALDAGHGLSREAAARAIASLWTSVSVSLAVLWLADRLPVWLAVTIVLAGGAGSATIAYYTRTASPGR
jgi:uncharacterized membrane protein YbaN (DUF454 family)